MILGTGIDIVHVNRMKRWLAMPSLLKRFFHVRELEDIRSRKTGAALSLAARFAAKEAYGKAMGTGLQGIALKDIQVINNYNGKPEIAVYGTAKEALANIGGKKIHLSLTHEKNNAVAMVIIEG